MCDVCVCVCDVCARAMACSVAFICARACVRACVCPGPRDDFQWDKLYTEGNARQWVWFVPQNVSALVELMGGAESFAANLNELMSKSRLDPVRVT